jgi:signal transduction histidine kinase
MMPPMLKANVRHLLDAFRPPRASGEDEAAFDAYLLSRVVLYACTAAVVFNVLHLVWWPTDAWLLVPDPAVHAAVRWFRVTTFVNHAVFIVLLTRAALRRYAISLFVVGMLVSSGMLAWFVASLGTLGEPYFHMTYLAPMATAAVPLRLRARVVANLLVGATIVLVYLGTRPSELSSRYLGAAVGCMLFAVAVSTLDGVVTYSLTRTSFLHERALSRSADALKGHSERLEERVAESVAQLRRLAVHAERVAEAERARFSRELHDELGQTITGMRYTLSFVRARFSRDPDAAYARIADVEKSLAELAAGVRDLVSELRPRVLDDLGLPAATEWLVERTRKRSGLPCELSLSIDGSVEVGPELATAVFRIVQESLTNAVRHAKARRLEVALEVAQAGVRAKVTDDGCGLGSAPANGDGMGLLGMRERARAHGGQITIESRPGAGTAVSLHLPLASEAAS